MISVKDLKELSCEQNILYVEDEEILREGMQNTLSKFFNNVYIATNGKEALELYKKEDIDLILTDINMPVMDGVEFIQEINKLNENPIIIVLSAHDEAELLYKLINLEVNSFLNKLSSKEELIKVLYKNCSIISNKKLLKLYGTKLEEENLAMIRKNKILEQKLNQLAHLQNSCEKVNNKSDKNQIKKTDEKYYENLIQEDKDELDDISQELEVLIMNMYHNKNFDKSNMYEISDLYRKYALTLSYYSAFYDFARTLEDFSSRICDYEEKILSDLNTASIYLESLHMSIETFRQNIWVKKGKNPRFYNASLKSDTGGIKLPRRKRR